MRGRCQRITHEPPAATLPQRGKDYMKNIFICYNSRCTFLMRFVIEVGLAGECAATLVFIISPLSAQSRLPNIALIT